VQVAAGLSYLLQLIEESSKSATQSVAERSTYCVALLVLVKACAPGKSFPKPLIRVIVETLLRFLKDKDVFIQDICCMTLCHLYHSADSTSPQALSAAADGAALTGLTGQAVSVADFISIEVMVALSREKKVAQPAGYNVGTSTSASAGTTTRTGTTAAAPAAPADTGAVAGGGGGGAARETNHLMQAAVAAAAELGVGLRLDAAGAEEIQSTQGDATPQDYVVYSMICKMAKTVSADSLLLFVVFSLSV
jgi:hypothetical protein